MVEDLIKLESFRLALQNVGAGVVSVEELIKDARTIEVYLREEPNAPDKV